MEENKELEQNIEDTTQSTRSLEETKTETQESEELTEKQQRREYRRQRRIRNQIMAYGALALTAIFVFVGIYQVSRVIFGKASSEKEIEQVQAQIEEELSEQEEIIISEPEQLITEKTPEEKLDEVVEACIEVMPLEDRVAGLFFVTPEDITGVNVAVRAGEGTQEALNQYAVGGMIYRSQNIVDESQLREMITNTEAWSKYPLFIGVEEEGGQVSTISRSSILIEEAAASPAIIAGTNNPEVAYNAGKITGSYLADLGFNLNFAPTCDVLIDENNSFLKERTYGSNPDIVSQMISSVVKGMEEEGINVCLKHFPGMGDLKQDTTAGMITTQRTLQHYKDKDLKVFQAGIEAGADFVMISNVSVPAITGDNTPCTLSKAIVTDCLRTELGFNGVVITDALNEMAITEYYEADEAAILALKAGCDMILMPEDFKKAYEGVLEAVQNGTISEERINDSLKRIYRIKYKDKMEE